ncbi:MAG: TrkA family potassium uptake protein [Clostridia bacterium]|jgi:trk system potassium uptake protein TrkA
MQLFKNEKGNKDYTIIVGCGRLGANLANTISDEGRNVLIIDKNKDAFRKLSPSFGGISIIGDATDFDILQEAQIDNASVVVSVTDNDNINIMVALIARDLFQIKCVISRLQDPERECVYREFGIDTICPAVLSAKEINRILAEMSTSEAVSSEVDQ